MKTPGTLNWGLVGLGGIAHQFISDLLLLDETKAVAVASRNLDKAKDFAEKYGVEKAYGNYDDILPDPDVDIIYIATPHDSHAELSIAAMNAGKHVLCEKPLAVNRSQVQSIIAAARKNEVFMMEAFWSKFNPGISEVLDLVKNGAIGEVNYVNADFAFYRDDPDDSRMLNMNLAGGSLLDLGVYPVFLAWSVFGKPQEIHAIGHLHTTGADLQTATLMKFENGIASLMSGFKSQSDMRARICGTKGSIFIEPFWHKTQGYSILDNQTGETRYFSRPTLGKGFTYEIKECLRCILNGQTESENWSHQNSLDLIEITDEIRRQVGVKYPFER